MKRVFLIIFALLLSSCGGGSSKSNETPAPTATNWDEMNWDQGEWS
ncbi:MAG: hypothetical protein HWE13_13725 [Gammaproteobacteria bacterium]|nr:hypothetical protein [Gammaproteobacteria bacterium]NVK89189.1 hypothetical protein [Gammaproteobacteria bacterium]